MSEANLRAQIKAIMEGVSGIGAVHDRERYSRSIADFFALMTSGGKINGWRITRQNSKATPLTMNQVERAHVFEIRGIYEINDEDQSEIAFQTLVENIFTSFRNNPYLNGTIFRSDMLQVDEVDIAEFVNRWFHVAYLELTVYERV